MFQISPNCSGASRKRRTDPGAGCMALWRLFSQVCSSTSLTLMTMSRSPSPSDARNRSHDERPSIVRRSLHAVLSPFSPSALALLPRLARPARYTRADDIPETQPNSEGQQPTVRDYHSINLPPQVRVPKKMPTPVRVEGKVWFANERSESWFCL